MPSRPTLQASRSAAFATALLSRLNRVVPLDLGAINIMAGLRAAFACALPVLLGELTGNTHLSWIAIAAFWGCLADTGGAWSDRLAAMGAFTAIATAGCFIGTLVDPHAGLAVAFTFVWCFLCSLARVYGNAASVVGLLLNSAILVTLGVPAAGLDEALRLGGLTIAGGLWAMLLALVLWRLQPYGPARKAVARCWLAVAEYAAALSQLHRGAAGDSAQWNDLASARRRATREAVESARDIVVATRRSRAGITSQGQRLLALLADADQVYAALIGLNELLEAASATASDSGVRRGVRVVLGRLAGRAEALAQTLQGETPRAQPDLKPIVDKLRARIAASSQPQNHAYTAELLHQVSRWIDAAFENLGPDHAYLVAALPPKSRQARREERSLVPLNERRATTHGAILGATLRDGGNFRALRRLSSLMYGMYTSLVVPGTARKLPPSQRSNKHDQALGKPQTRQTHLTSMVEQAVARRLRLSEIIGTLRANLHFGSVAFRHALRLAITAALAVLATRVFDIQRGYWISITAIVVLQPYMVETWRRTFDRIAGSVLGGLIAAWLMQLVQAPLQMALLIFPLSVFAFALRSVNYALFMLCMTPLVVLIAELFQTGGIGDAHLAGMRALDSILGGLLGLAASFLLWPSWETPQLPRQMADAVRAHRDYLLVVLGGKPGASDQDIGAARRQAGLSSNNAEASLQRVLSETRLLSGGAAEPALITLACLRRMGGAIVTLSLLPQFTAGGAPQPHFAAVRRWADEALSDLAQALERRQVPAALPVAPQSLAAASGKAETELTQAATAVIAWNELLRFRRQLEVLHEAAGRLASPQALAAVSADAPSAPA